MKHIRAMTMAALAAILLAQPAFGQATGDIRSVSWWLDRWSSALHIPRDLLWTLVIAINLGVLIWLLYKMLFQGAEFSLPAVMHRREQSIADHLAEAEQAHQAAMKRLAEAEASVANLPAELARLAAEAQAEAEREYQKVLAESRQEAERAAERARQEIETAARLAQKQLKNFAAELALDLAERRIRERMTPEADRVVVRQATEKLAGTGRPV